MLCAMCGKLTNEYEQYIVEKALVGDLLADKLQDMIDVVGADRYLIAHTCPTCFLDFCFTAHQARAAIFALANTDTGTEG